MLDRQQWKGFNQLKLFPLFGQLRFGQLNSASFHPASPHEASMNIYIGLSLTTVSLTYLTYLPPVDL